MLKLIHQITQEHYVLILSTGFEQRVTRGVERLLELDIRISEALILRYVGKEHEENTSKIRYLVEGLTSNAHEIDIFNEQEVYAYFRSLDLAQVTLLVDITGLSRVAMMRLLSLAYDCNLRIKLIYTEAKEYYPTRDEFAEIARPDDGDLESAFLRLSQFENKEVLYSASCEVEEVAGLRGKLLPNYPLMLIGFLTFKRGRISAILQRFESNHRVLVKSVPVREDLAWRKDAIEIPNLDLLDDAEVKELETLNWRATYDFLSWYYESDNNKYRFNFVVAPLGSKMQTIGAWLFAKERPDVKVVTSTPTKIFFEKYSVGFGDTFFFDDIPQKVLDLELSGHLGGDRYQPAKYSR